MNHKPAPTTSPPKAYRVDDIVYSDADTLPEFSNRDGSKESTDKSWQLMMVRVAETVHDTKMIGEMVTCDLNATWKLPPSSFAFCSAPHLPILHVAYATAKKTLGTERAQIRSFQHFAEPRNDKLHIAKDAEMKCLKFAVILGANKFSWDKPESHQDVAKRIETTLSELMRVIPNVVLFLGPIAFDILYESLDKQKRKADSPVKIVVENFRRKNKEWKRVQKTGASSISAPVKTFM